MTGSITVQLTSCFTSLDEAAMGIFNLHQIYFFGQIQTRQTGGRPYRDTYPPSNPLKFGDWLEGLISFYICISALIKRQDLNSLSFYC